jgi:hypothetical protein
MERKICNHCGSEYVVKNYTKQTLRDRIMQYVEIYSPRTDDLVVSLAKEGFVMKDVRREVTSLWDEKKLNFTPQQTWVIREDHSK